MLGISPFARSYIRRRATRLLLMTCKITRPGGSSSVVYDPVTRKATRATGSKVVYEGNCRYWEVMAGSKTVVGEQELNVTQSWVSIPYDAKSPDGSLAEVEADDLITFTASPEGEDIDPLLTGRTVNVVSIIFGGGLRASRRMQVEFTDRKESGQ